MPLRAAGLLLALGALASAQSLVAPEQMAAALRAFDVSSAPPLRCQFNSVRPALNFGFRFQTGYTIDLPLAQLQGPGHALKTLLRVTPDGREPVYLASDANLPEIPATRLDAEIGGTFVVGEGAYTVEALLADDQQRTCRGKWRIEARRSGSERDLNLATPPSAVQPLALAGVPESKARPRINRLTVLMHAAPLSPAFSKLQADDVLMLAGSLSSLMEQLPARSVRLIVFNLDQQTVLFRKDGFTAADLDRVTIAANQLQLALVDYRILKNRDKPVDLLSDLLQAELREPADAVILLGPRTRIQGAPSEWEVRPPAPPLFYVQYWPQRGFFGWRERPPLPGRGGYLAGRGTVLLPDDVTPVTARPLPDLPDGISQMLRRLKGETIAVETPRDFAGAIRRMSSRIPAAAMLAAESPRPSPTQQQPPPPPAAPIEDDPIEVLVRVRDQVMAHGRVIPNHTCVEAVERARYEPVQGRMPKSCDAILATRKQADLSSLLRLESTDRLRLDVAMTTGHELYSWPGASRFEDADLDRWIPDGPIGTGPFAALLLSIFKVRDPQFAFEGDTTLDGRRLLEYTFKVALDDSQYHVKGRPDWLITGYTGSLLVDPKTAELVRLTVHTDELPAETTLCQTDTTLDFGMAPLAGVDYLLPKAARQRFIGRDGFEAENRISFASCREYRGQSILSFGEKPVNNGPEADVTLQAFPPGMPVTVELTSPISAGDASAGDLIQGRLAKSIYDAQQNLLAPEGAAVEGRLMRVETRHSRGGEITISLRWETLEVKGAKMPLAMVPRRRLDDLKTGAPGGLRTRGIEIELPLPGESRYGVYHFPRDQAIVESGFRTEWTTVER